MTKRQKTSKRHNLQKQRPNPSVGRAAALPLPEPEQHQVPGPDAKPAGRHTGQNLVPGKHIH